MIEDGATIIPYMVPVSTTMSEAAYPTWASQFGVRTPTRPTRCRCSVVFQFHTLLLRSDYLVDASTRYVSCVALRVWQEHPPHLHWLPPGFGPCGGASPFSAHSNDLVSLCAIALSPLVGRTACGGCVYSTQLQLPRRLPHTALVFMPVSHVGLPRLVQVSCAYSMRPQVAYRRQPGCEA